MFAVCKWQCCDGGCEYWRGNDEWETHEHDRGEKDMYIYWMLIIYAGEIIQNLFYKKKK